MAINLDALLIHVIVNVVIITPVLWIAGRALKGKEKAKFTDSLMIVVLGTVIGSVLQFAFSGIVASLIVLIVWLALTKHFFDCGWLRAFLIALVAVVIFVVIGVVLALLGVFALRTLLSFP
jgi:chromate transport protein ChrA